MGLDSAAGPPLGTPDPCSDKVAPAVTSGTETQGPEQEGRAVAAAGNMAQKGSNSDPVVKSPLPLPAAIIIWPADLVE